MKIAVTQEHIYNGNREQACDCPVALALRDVCKWTPQVFGTSVTFGSVVAVHDLPQIAQEFIRRFDRGAYVEPFEFEMEVPA